MSPLPRPFRLSPLLAALTVTALLAGCTTPASKREAAAENLPADPNALVLGAEMALQRGQYLEARRTARRDQLD